MHCATSVVASIYAASDPFSTKTILPGAAARSKIRDQADYIGVKVEGPYKPEHYRY